MLIQLDVIKLSADNTIHLGPGSSHSKQMEFYIKDFKIEPIPGKEYELICTIDYSNFDFDDSYDNLFVENLESKIIIHF